MKGEKKEKRRNSDPANNSEGGSEGGRDVGGKDSTRNDTKTEQSDQAEAQAQAGENSSASGFFRNIKEKVQGIRLQGNQDINQHSNPVSQALWSLLENSVLTPSSDAEPPGATRGSNTSLRMDNNGETGIHPTGQTTTIRILCISDTHNSPPSYTTLLNAAKSKAGKIDILVHAGDLTNGGTYQELLRARDWFLRAPQEAVEIKLIVPGNHDCGLDRGWWEREGRWGRAGGEDCENEDGWWEKEWEKCVELFTGEEARRAGVVYLGPVPGEDDDGIGGNAGRGREMVLSSGARVRVWGCPAMPVIPKHGNEARRWAFGYLGPGDCGNSLHIPPSDDKNDIGNPTGNTAEGVTPVGICSECHPSGTNSDPYTWQDLRPGLDLFITHCPPKYHLDWPDTLPSHSDSPSIPITTVDKTYHPTSSKTPPTSDPSLDPRIPATTDTGSSEGIDMRWGPKWAKFHGSESLRQALWRCRPKVHVFGHVHQRGGTVRVVRWEDVDGEESAQRGVGRVTGAEERVVEWVPGGGARSGDGGAGGGGGGKVEVVDLTGKGKGKGRGKKRGEWKVVGEEVSGGSLKKEDQNETDEQTGGSAQNYPTDQVSKSQDNQPHLTEGTPSNTNPTNPLLPSPLPPQGLTHSLGLSPLLAGKETCLVNASYVTQSWAARWEMARTRQSGGKLVRGVVVVEMEVEIVKSDGVTELRPLT